MDERETGPEITDEMIDAEVARMDRNRRRWFLAAGAVGLVVLTASLTAIVTLAVSGGDGVAAEDSVSDVSQITATGSAQESEVPSSTTYYAVGRPVRNGGITLTVDKVGNPPTYQRVSNSMRKDSEYAEFSAVSPRAGGKFVQIDATVLNSGVKAIDLTCSWPINAVVVDTDGRNYKPVDSLYELPGTPGCNDDLNPGFDSHMIWVFEVPSAANITLFGFADTDTDAYDHSAIELR